jgi:hypothetical protein
MWNPPSALLLVPLGFLGPIAGELLWSLLLLACLIVWVRMVWIMHGCPMNQLHLLGYSFAPALACLLAGQVSFFVLLGLALFLRLHRSSPFLAGVSLWLCMLKPNMFLPFGVVLLVWAIITRSYRLLVGTAVATRRQHRDCRSPGPSNLDALSPNGERSADGRSHSVLEPRVALELKPEPRLAPISTGGSWLHLVACLLLEDTATTGIGWNMVRL